MGQRGSSRQNPMRLGCLANSSGTLLTPQMLPAAPSDMTPHPILPFEAWLSAAEAELVREWRLGRQLQRRGVSAASPLVPLTCDAVPFPLHRSTGVAQHEGEAGKEAEVPVGIAYFEALRAVWRRPDPARRVPPPTETDALDEQMIVKAIEETVGRVMTPAVPLSYMVSEILVPQWDVQGLYELQALRNAA